MFAFRCDSRVFEKHHDTPGSAGDETRFADTKQSQIKGVQTVHVLVRGNGANYSILVKAFWQRELAEYSMYVRIIIQLGHKVFEIPLFGHGRKIVLH